MSNTYGLAFIDDETLRVEVKKVVDKAMAAAVEGEKNLYSNVVDPFSAVFDAMRQEVSLSDWIEQEKARQVQKTLQNAIGDFHQAILGKIGDWEDLHVGGVVDIRSKNNRVIAEVKNKFNTTKGSDQKTIYDNLESRLNGDYKGYTGYYVEIIPKSKHAYDKPFTPSDNVAKKRRPKNDYIRKIDGRSFYALVTNQEDALDQLYQVLPTVIADVLGNTASIVINDSLYESLFKKAYPFS